jgi:hypothetical protein
MGAGDTSGDWLIVQELFERGDPSFVDEVRKFDNADTLGEFAPRWFADQRPEARRSLLDYLDRPLNAFRHEALVKRLFKLAEKAGDYEVMGAFLVAFDRSVRRTTGRRLHNESQTCKTEAEANALAAAWNGMGFISVGVYQNRRNSYHVWGYWAEPVLVTPRDTTMPRGTLKETVDPDSLNRVTWRYSTFAVPDWVFALRLDPLGYRNGGEIPPSKRPELLRRRLFSTATRAYLRRRAWRYFRKLGRQHPERYVTAVSASLVRYRDEDVGDGLALMDNWGLMHVLFHFSPCLTYDDRSFKLAEGHTLDELEPAPIFAKLWEAQPRAVFDLMVGARCRPVRSWAIAWIRRDPAPFAAVCSLEDRLGLLEHDDPEVVGLAADMLRDDPSLKDIPVERWLRLVEAANPAALDLLTELMSRLIDPAHVTLADAVRLAGSRPLPTARLGLAWLQTKVPASAEECRSLLALTEAESEAVRPEIVRWVAGVLSQSEHFQPEWVLELLDSRYEDVRAEGWNWFLAKPRVHQDVQTWQRLMETPYDDVRLALVRDLDARLRDSQAARLDRDELDPELLRLLWASVLLNTTRGSREKPAVLRQLLKRMQSRPAELPRLLPLVAVALRSVRGPEMRAGLSAVVRLAERDEDSARLIAAHFGELQFV